MYIKIKTNQGITRYISVVKFEIVEYLNDASEKIIIKKVIKKIIF